MRKIFLSTLKVSLSIDSSQNPHRSWNPAPPRETSAICVLAFAVLLHPDIGEKSVHTYCAIKEIRKYPIGLSHNRPAVRGGGAFVYRYDRKRLFSFILRASFPSLSRRPLHFARKIQIKARIYAVCYYRKHNASSALFLAAWPLQFSHAG